MVFESAELSTPSPSGNTADLVVTTGRYDKRKKQTSGRIKKTYQLALVGNANNLEGCYLNATNSVTESIEKICNSIEAANWNGSSCEMTSPFNKSCPSGEALDEIDSTGSFQCCNVKWEPHPNQWCSGVNFRQKTGCDGERTATGTKTPNTYSPSPSTVNCGESFTQTETCCRGFTVCAPNTQNATGIKCNGPCGSPCCPACPPPPPPAPPPSTPQQQGGDPDEGPEESPPEESQEEGGGQQGQQGNSGCAVPNCRCYAHCSDPVSSNLSFTLDICCTSQGDCNHSSIGYEDRCNVPLEYSQQ